MGKSPVGTRLNEAKYGMALYGAAWPKGEYFFVCGGGGHGLVNRIVWGQYKDGRCSDQIGEYKLGKETPMRMLMCPWGASLLLGNANGGIRLLQICSDDPVEHRPKLVEVSAAFQEKLTGLSAEVSTMRFNSRGDKLAVGFRDNSMVQLLTTVGGNGVCQIWEVQRDQQRLVAKLEPPKDKATCVFARCRWARRGAPLLYALVNYRMGRDQGSYLAAYGRRPLPGSRGSCCARSRRATRPPPPWTSARTGSGLRQATRTACCGCTTPTRCCSSPRPWPA
ncbi:hypothetical protein COO60DRAFT_1698480 [Scenedesmus sp. NREL 46B-D3]|nr:hypothetical protein COO60DRAFT_1698480 [Scenedesmus sp. NREL 46B-D3]